MVRLFSPHLWGTQHGSLLLQLDLLEALVVIVFAGDLHDGDFDNLVMAYGVVLAKFL